MEQIGFTQFELLSGTSFVWPHGGSGNKLFNSWSHSLGWVVNDSLEPLGTLCLPHVVTLQRQLPAHDLDEVLGEQTWEREEQDVGAAAAG